MGKHFLLLSDNSNKPMGGDESLDNEPSQQHPEITPLRGRPQSHTEESHSQSMPDYEALVSRYG